MKYELTTKQAVYWYGSGLICAVISFFEQRFLAFCFGILFLISIYMTLRERF